MLSFHTDHRLLLIVPVSVFAALSVIIAILPAKAGSMEPTRALSPAALRGRAIYQAEGCSYCHTQQVRQDTRQPLGPDGRYPPLAVDARFGRPSRPEDYSADDPPFLGTERTGPDLQNVGARLPSREWHLTHLLDPRAVSPSSMMPAYRWYFTTEGDPAKDHRILLPAAVAERYAEEYGPNVRFYDTQDARDLVEYLLSLRTEPNAR